MSNVSQGPDRVQIRADTRLYACSLPGADKRCIQRTQRITGSCAALGRARKGCITDGRGAQGAAARPGGPPVLRSPPPERPRYTQQPWWALPWQRRRARQERRQQRRQRQQRAPPRTKRRSYPGRPRSLCWPAAGSCLQRRPRPPNGWCAGARRRGAVCAPTLGTTLPVVRVVSLRARSCLRCVTAARVHARTCPAVPPRRSRASAAPAGARVSRCASRAARAASAAARSRAARWRPAAAARGAASSSAAHAARRALPTGASARMGRAQVALPRGLCWRSGADIAAPVPPLPRTRAARGPNPTPSFDRRPLCSWLWKPSDDPGWGARGE